MRNAPVLLAALAPAALATAAAQDYPTKPVRLIIPFPLAAATTWSAA
jgi:tripartite-type tricarboxylate transporter receptor subunit TctC